MESIIEALANKFGVVPDTILKLMYGSAGIILVVGGLTIAAWIIKFVQSKPQLEE